MALTDDEKEEIAHKINYEGFEYYFLFYASEGLYDDEGFNEVCKAFNDAMGKADQWLKESGIEDLLE